MSVEDRFIPHGTRCDADDGRQDYGKCIEVARRIMWADGKDRYVCQRHYDWWVRDHPDPVKPGTKAQR